MRSALCSYARSGTAAAVRSRRWRGASGPGRRLALATVAAAALALPAAGQNAGTRVRLNPPVAHGLQLIFETAEVEIGFCVRGRYDPAKNLYLVTEVYVAPQTGNTNRAAVVACVGADGILHNHPEWEREACELSDRDRHNLMAQEWTVMVGWCPRRPHWFFGVRTTNGRLIESP